MAVFNDGVVQQCASPDELYERPSNAFVANFIGENNLIPGSILGVDGAEVRVSVSGGQDVTTQLADVAEAGSACIVSVRPEKMFIRSSGHDYDNIVTARFVVSHYVGDFIRYYFELPDGSQVMVKTLNDAAAPRLEEGQDTELIWQTADCSAFQGLAG